MMAILEFFLTDPDGAALEQFVYFEWRAKKFVGIDKRASIDRIRFGKMIASRRLIKDNVSVLSRLPFYFLHRIFAENLGFYVFDFGICQREINRYSVFIFAGYGNAVPEIKERAAGIVV